MSEVSDAITIVVSEETGKVSMCHESVLTAMKDEKQLTKAIMDIIYGYEANLDSSNKILSTMKGWFK